MNRKPHCMEKAWRNPRQVIIHKMPAEANDVQRMNRLVSLLATGVERLVSEQSQIDTSKTVDFQADIVVNTPDPD
jgi:hypothetical protein